MVRGVVKSKFTQLVWEGYVKRNLLGSRLSPRFRIAQAIWRVFVLALACFLVSPVAVAQQGTAVLTGTVVDASTKKPIPDAVVTVTSPSLQGWQTVVTDSSGSYRVPN